MTRRSTALVDRFAPAAGAAVLVLAAASLHASTLDVQNANKNTGTYAARVGVASSCLGDLHEVLTGTIGAGAYVGCSTLTAEADLASGAATFTAGDLVILRDGFSVATGATLTVEIDRALYPDAWVQDDTPDGETVYAARFYIDPSQLALDEGDRFFHFLAFDGSGSPEVRVGVKRTGTERRLFLEAFEDAGTFETTEGANELLLPTGWHWVEVGWSAGSGNGSAYLCVDAETPPSGCESLSSLDNDTGAIDFVRWGAVDVPSDTDLGDLDLDDFESRRSLLIGPLP